MKKVCISLKKEIFVDPGALSTVSCPLFSKK